MHAHKFSKPLLLSLIFSYEFVSFQFIFHFLVHLVLHYWAAFCKPPSWLRVYVGRFSFCDMRTTYVALKGRLLQYKNVSEYFSGFGFGGLQTHDKLP